MKKKRSGHYCRICGSRKSNESFSGSGHHAHICKACSKIPKEKREAKEQADEIFEYLRQSNISDKNKIRLKILTESPNAKTAELAAIVLEVAEVKSHKRRRIKALARERRDLLRKLDETGLIMAHYL